MLAWACTRTLASLMVGQAPCIPRCGHSMKCAPENLSPSSRSFKIDTCGVLPFLGSYFYSLFRCSESAKAVRAYAMVAVPSQGLAKAVSTSRMGCAPRRDCHGRQGLI